MTINKSPITTCHIRLFFNRNMLSSNMVTNILKDENKNGDGAYGTLEIDESSISMLSSNANPTSTPAKSRIGFFSKIFKSNIKEFKLPCLSVKLLKKA